MNTNLKPNKDRLRAISNFTGSNAYAIVLQQENEKSHFVTDSRYDLQVKQEIDSDHYSVSTNNESISKKLKQVV